MDVFIIPKSKSQWLFHFPIFNLHHSTDVDDPSVVCVVVDDKKVNYQGKIYSISRLATKLLGKTRSVNGLKYFSHNGEVLLDLWKRILC